MISLVLWISCPAPSTRGRLSFTLAIFAYIWYKDGMKPSTLRWVLVAVLGLFIALGSTVYLARRPQTTVVTAPKPHIIYEAAFDPSKVVVPSPSPANRPQQMLPQV